MMNERIKQLAEEARIQMCSDARLQEFAELIIKECVDVSLKSSLRPDDMGAIIANHIKRHFDL